MQNKHWGCVVRQDVSGGLCIRQGMTGGLVLGLARESVCYRANQALGMCCQARCECTPTWESLISSKAVNRGLILGWA